ncbi:MAG: diguanylate cyclase [Ketobacteraceae bacterium]|nr:diguanylate cyclase [Ketobacteraceae bacterium]
MTHASAESPVTLDKTEINLTLHYQWFRTDAALDINTILSPGFQPPWRTDRPLPAGYVTDSLWLKVTLVNPFNRPLERYLVFDSPLLDKVDLYLVREATVIQEKHHRIVTPVDYREIEHRLITLPLSLPANAATELYLHIQTDTSLQLGATLWQPEAFLLSDQHWLTLHVFLLGMMSVMALYNLAIYLITRIRAYLLYVAYVVSNAAFQACMVGFAHQYLFGSSAPLLDNGQFTLAAITFVTAAAFIDELLKLKLTAPLFHRLAMAIIVAWGALFLLSFLIPEATLGPVIIPLAIGAPIVGLWVGIHLWRKGYEIAPIFTIAWVVLLVGTCVFVLMINGLIVRNLFTVHIQEIGAAIEVVLLAITLAKRLQIERHKRHRAQQNALLMAQQVNNERKGKLEAQASALEAERKAREAQEKLVQTQIQTNIELEKMVEQRTFELKTALEQVEEMNERLETLSITDALTGVYNRRYFDEQLREEYQRARHQQTPLGLVLMDIDHFKQVNDDYGHLVGDQCLKLVGQLLQEQTRQDVDIVARYGGEEFAVICPGANEQQLEDICERVRVAIQTTPYHSREIGVRLTASIGVAMLDPDMPQSLENLLQQADDALYVSKQNGRNRTTFARPPHPA